MSEPSVDYEVKKQTHRAADELFREFERMIVSGELGDGEALPPEREIVETFGVSRTVVREAILALSNKGLVEAKPRFRPVVRKPSYDTAISTIESVIGHLIGQPNGVKNLFDTRTFVEVALAREAAKHAQREDLESLQLALEENGAAIENSEQFYQTDKRFHAVLFEIPRNPVFPAVQKAYTTWLFPYWSQMPRLADRNRENYEAHTAIYNAILMRDPDEAEACMRRHLADAWEQVKRVFEDDLKVHL